MKSESFEILLAASAVLRQGSRLTTGLGFGLLEWRHRRARRQRNLAELRALDAGRLADIGLSEEARARIAG